MQKSKQPTWPIIPLILHPVQLPPRLTMLTRLDGTNPDEWAAIVERLCRRVAAPCAQPCAQAVPGLPTTQPEARRLLLVVNQFEDLFTLARSDV